MLFVYGTHCEINVIFVQAENNLVFCNIWLTVDEKYKENWKSPVFDQQLKTSNSKYNYLERNRKLRIQEDNLMTEKESTLSIDDQKIYRSMN